jgi:hypothetical protein
MNGGWFDGTFFYQQHERCRMNKGIEATNQFNCLSSIMTTKVWDEYCCRIFSNA